MADRRSFRNASSELNLSDKERGVSSSLSDGPLPKKPAAESRSSSDRYSKEFGSSLLFSVSGGLWSLGLSPEHEIPGVTHRKFGDDDDDDDDDAGTDDVDEDSDDTAMTARKSKGGASRLAVCSAVNALPSNGSSGVFIDVDVRIRVGCDGGCGCCLFSPFLVSGSVLLRCLADRSGRGGRGPDRGPVEEAVDVDVDVDDAPRLPLRADLLVLLLRLPSAFGSTPPLLVATRSSSRSLLLYRSERNKPEDDAPCFEEGGVPTIFCVTRLL
mmetsp:Transcript_17899/g.37177  ORF Transcript_17899/g.37177 Transcript_17899/m.37177 type:complete len:270 (-) Transcript_17899:259-1068(-)